MKKFWIGASVCGGLLVGAGLAYARAIPGVDRPFNPSAYYSSTAVSYADSPSTFFYRDLAGGGYIVHDPTRKSKNVLSEAQFKEIFDALQKLLNLKELDMLPFASALKDKIVETQQATQALHQAGNIAERADKVFGTVQSSDEDLAERTEKKQISYLNEVYRAATESAAQSLKNGENRQNLLMNALERSGDPEGELQARQASNELYAIVQEEMSERNMLLGNFASMMAAKQKAEEDRNAREARARSDAIPQLQFSDPYHMDAYESRAYEKPKPPGFLDF